MIFLDINTFYSEKAGGIRTYHGAKIAWFQQQSEHHYFVICPGPAFKEKPLGPQVTLIEVYGPCLTKDPKGYRLILDYYRIAKLIQTLNPNIVEAGDPWLTGLFCLAYQKLSKRKRLWSSFYHSDPVVTYMLPWSRRGDCQWLKGPCIKFAGKIFYALQRQYALTCVSSKTMDESLARQGIKNRALTPFGVDSIFLQAAIQQEAPKAIRLLYAGRLDADKGIDLLIEMLPQLLEKDGVEISILGRGSKAPFFAEYNHPKLHYLGFAETRVAVAEVYHGHTILLAPGPFETFGLGVLEAAACGLIVIGPDQGGTGELLQEMQSPFIFKAGDAQDFMQVIEKALGLNTHALAAEANRAQSLAQKYGSSLQAMEKQIGIYQKTWEGKYGKA